MSPPFHIRWTQRNPHEWGGLLKSESETINLGMAVAHRLDGGEIVTLTGELGAGKTSFVRGLAQGLGISKEEVSSPTFTMIQEYGSHPPLIHVDLYRLESHIEVEDIGLFSYFDGNYVVAIEWADRLPPPQLPTNRIGIHLAHKNRRSREVVIKAFGEKTQRLIKALTEPG